MYPQALWRTSFLGVCSLFFLIVIFSGCKRDNLVDVTDNNAPWWDEVSLNQVENYVNRSYIDLIGREPLDSEMIAEVIFLKDSELSVEARDQMLSKLQLDSSFVDGDSSYRRAYYRRFYELAKVRCLEGASDGRIGLSLGIILNAARIDSLEGDSVNYHKNLARALRLSNILDSEWQYRDGLIQTDEVFSRMVNNDLYDDINMNTFNLINASFNDLFFRYPTSVEFNISFDMIEYNLSGSLFGLPGQNKDDFAEILTGSREFSEGMIRWAYLTLLAREPSTQEIFDQMESFQIDYDFQKVQRSVMISDEYANF